MKETTINKAFAAAMWLLAVVALVGVFLGHHQHLFTLGASALVAAALDADVQERQNDNGDGEN